MRTRNISLLGLLAIVTCVAIGISHVITSIRLARVNSELSALRRRLELIDVADTDQIAARRLPSADQHTHRWVVRVPNATSKRLYANWGAAPLRDLRDVDASGVRVFRLVPDTDTLESFVALRFKRNPRDRAWGAVVIEIDGKVSDITINPELTSLVIGDTPSKTTTVADSPTIRAASSTITLFASESTSVPKVAFCLWLGAPTAPDGG